MTLAPETLASLRDHGASREQIETLARGVTLACPLAHQPLRCPVCRRASHELGVQSCADCYRTERRPCATVSYVCPRCVSLIEITVSRPTMSLCTGVLTWQADLRTDGTTRFQFHCLHCQTRMTAILPAARGGTCRAAMGHGGESTTTSDSETSGPVMPACVRPSS